MGDHATPIPGITTSTGGSKHRKWTDISGGAGTLHSAAVSLYDSNGNQLSGGGSASTDNAAFTPGASSLTVAAGFVDDTSTNAVSEDSVGAIRMSTRRELYSQLRDAAGNERGANVNASNALLVAQTGALATGDNAIGRVKITDGADVADVLDLANSNPLVVALVDTSGDQIASFGGGTQYTEDAAAAANPVGTVPILVRKDTPGSEVSADGDNVAQRGTTYGAAYVTLLDTGGNAVSVGGGTQYTEDAAAAANPIGTALIMVREDARGGSLTSADGDNVAARGTNAGELYVKHVDAIPITDNSGSLTVDGTVAVTNAGLTELAAAIDTEVQVDVVGALPAGDNNIGNVDLASSIPAGTNNIGDVDILSVVPGTGATALGKAEDAAHSSGDTGVYVLAVRDDSLAPHSGTDGDYESLHTDADGALWVKHSGNVTVNAHAVTNAGTFAVQVDGNALTALQLIDDVVFVDDAAYTPGTSKLAVIGAQADEGSPDAVDEGDAGALRMTLSRALHVNLRDASGSEVAVGGGTQYTEDAAAAANPVGNALIMVRADSLAGVTSADGDNVAARGTDNGELYVKHVDAIPVTDNGGALTVDGTVAVTNAGTFATQVDGAALTALQLIDDTVFAEDVAAQAADKGIAILAVRRDADTSLVGADNDYANLQVDANGALKVEIFDGGGSHTVDNAGTFAVQVDGSALTALQLIDNPVLVDDAGFTPATSSVMMAGFQADESSTDSVDEGDAGAARMTLDRKVIVNLQPHTAGGATYFYNLDVDETEDAIKASAGQLYELYLVNTTNALLYVKLYNATTANVTVGSTTPVMTIPVPGNNDTDGAGVVRNWPTGLLFDTAITIAATTGGADNDTGAPAANAIYASGAYK